MRRALGISAALAFAATSCSGTTSSERQEYSQLPRVEALIPDEDDLVQYDVDVERIISDDCAYEVKAGESLSEIAKSVLGLSDYWLLQDLNDIEDPDMVFAGDILDVCLPAEIITEDTELEVNVLNGGNVELAHVSPDIVDGDGAPVIEFPVVTSASTTQNIYSTSISPATSPSTTTSTSTLPPTTTVIPADCTNNYSFHGSPENISECVSAIQYNVNLKGCNAGPGDGIFGAGTDMAVRRFQRANNLDIDGKVGPITFERLVAADSIGCSSEDNDEDDRLACQVGNEGKKCILVHQINGLNYMELIDENDVVVDSFLVNTGMEGARTRNTLTSQILRDSFPTEQSRLEVNDGPLVANKSWYGVRQVLAEEDARGLMYLPHTFNGGQAIHGRAFTDYVDPLTGKSIPLFGADGRPLENRNVNGGSESYGCIHVEWVKLDQYDDTYFVEGVAVRVLDQPLS
ncbi:MAG: peptidoglycan-binding protein [bacterium]|nr:peptidoglycan-binding protein [bacterium]